MHLNLRGIIFFFCFVTVIVPAFGATRTWDGSASANWSDLNNWVENIVPTTGDDLVFPSGASNVSTSNDIAGGTSFASITFGAGRASTYTLAGNAIVLSGGATAIAANNTSLTKTISLNITFSTAAPTITVASGGTLTISGTIDNGGYLITHSCAGTGTLSGVISGAGGLTKSGAGTLTISASNTFTGTTTVSVGTLALGAAGDATNTPLGTTAAGTTVASNAFLDVAGFTLGTAEALTINGAHNSGTLINSGSAATYSGNITIVSGTYTIISGPLTLTGTISRTSGNLRFIGTIIVNGSIQVGAGQLQLYSGSTTTINTASSHTGGTLINNSTLILGHAGALSTSGTVTLNTTASTLDLNGITPSTALNFNVKGTGVSGVGAIINSSSTSATYQGLITLTDDASIMTTGGNITVSNVGSITGAYDLTLGGSYTGALTSILATSTGGVTKTGSGTWILSGANTYDGLTTISAGTLRASNASALGSTSGATTITGTATPYTWLDISGVTITGETVTLNAGSDRSYISSTGTSVWNGTITISGTGIAALSPSSGTLTVQGTIGGSANSLHVRGNGDGIMDAIISIGGTTLAKTDNGTWTINSTGNTWGRTLIVSGKVKLGAAGVIPDASAVTVSTSTTVLDMNTYSETVGSITGDGTIDNVAGAGTPTLTCGGDGTSTTFSGVIKNTTGTLGLSKAGAGTLTLSGVNTYTGTTTISAGILKLGAAGDATNTPLGTTGAGTTVASGAALDLGGYTLGTAEALTISGTGVSSGGALMNSGAAATYSGLITLAAASSILGGTGTIAISNVGTITGATFGLTLGGAQGGSVTSIIGTTSGTLTKQDAGTWTLSGVNTYTGTTTISAGTLKLGAAGVIPDGSAVTVTGTLDMNTYSETVGSIAGAGTIDNVAGAGTPTLTCGGDNTSTTFSGIIQNTTGTLGFTKTGSGTLTLSGANTYSGTTTLNQGTITLSGGNNRLPSATTLAFNAALASAPTTVLALGTNNQTIAQLTFPNLASTTATVTGSGASTLTINGAYDLGVGQGGALTSTYAYTLDLSGLPNFVYNSSTNDIVIGLDAAATTNTVDPGTYILTLATNNTITADNIYVGRGVASSNGGTASLNMGATNTLNVGDINVGYNMRNNATMQFSAGGSTATIRNTDGTSAVTTWNVGKVTTYNATTWASTVDLSNGTIDALVTTMIIGAATDQGANRMGTTNATFTLGAGTLTATSLTVGTMFDGGNSVGGVFAANGTLTINHASAILNVTTLTLGTNTMDDVGGTRTISSTVNLTSGKINATSIEKGAQTGTATLTMAFNWTNGTIANLGSANLTVTDVPMALVAGTHTFDISSSYTGTLNSNSILSGATGITKTSAGTLTTSAVNTYTGTTTITGGTLQLGAAGVISNSSNVALSGGYLSTGSGAGYAENVGTLTLTAHSRIVLGTGSHALNFAASNGTTWTAATLLRVTGWQGSWNSTTGTSGKIYTGSSAELSAAKLLQIFFTHPISGMPYTATQLGTGEVVPTSTLPVKLVSFTGEKGKNFNELYWITASEINSEYFEVQRSSDGVNFESIGKVNAAGNSNNILQYSFVDYEQPSGTSYYRLKQFDYDGQNETFNTVAIDNSIGSEFKLNALFPNPANASITVNFQASELGAHFIFINDAQGNEIFKATIATLKGDNKFVLPTQNYASGTYFVRIVSPKKESISSQIVVQH